MLNVVLSEDLKYALQDHLKIHVHSRAVPVLQNTKKNEILDLYFLLLDWLLNYSFFIEFQVSVKSTKIVVWILVFLLLFFFKLVGFLILQVADYIHIHIFYHTSKWWYEIPYLFLSSYVVKQLRLTQIVETINLNSHNI